MEIDDLRKWPSVHKPKSSWVRRVEHAWSRPLSPTRTTKERWFFFTLLLMSVGIRLSSCLRILPEHEEDGGRNEQKCLIVKISSHGRLLQRYSALSATLPSWLMSTLFRPISTPVKEKNVQFNVPPENLSTKTNISKQTAQKKTLDPGLIQELIDRLK